MPKPRPIVGHKQQLEDLRSDIEAGNVAHAYLFAGPRHLGKMTVARWFASQLLLKGLSSEEADATQKQIERLTHPDLLSLDQLWIEDSCDDWEVIAQTSNIPQRHRSKKPAAKTDVISIDDIRVLQERLHETGMGTYRCCIIRSMERMKDTAANAFLKILEEPPPGLVFILTTQAFSRLLPTIVSRTRILRFQSLPKRELLPLLEGVAEDDAQFILHLAQRAPGIVSILCEDPDILRGHRVLHEKASSFWQSSSLRERLQLIALLRERGEEAERFLFHLGLVLREQSPALSPQHVEAFGALVRGLQTNAHRQLLTQRFALTVSG